MQKKKFKTQLVQVLHMQINIMRGERRCESRKIRCIYLPGSWKQEDIKLCLPLNCCCQLLTKLSIIQDYLD